MSHLLLPPTVHIGKRVESGARVGTELDVLILPSTLTTRSISCAISALYNSLSSGFSVCLARSVPKYLIFFGPMINDIVSL